MDTLLDRFFRYVKVETTAVEQTDKYPSSPGQLELGRMLADELRAGTPALPTAALPVLRHGAGAGAAGDGEWFGAWGDPAAQRWQRQY